MTLATVHDGEVLSGLSLSELARTVRDEDARAIAAAGAVIHHAIAAGDALLAAKEQVPRGQWQKWLRENCCEPDAQYASSRLYTYMRMALNRDLVMHSGAATVLQARKLLSREIYARGQGLGHRLIDLDPSVLDLVRRGEITQREAAKRLGVSVQTVRNRLDGGKKNRENQHRLAAARRALKRQQRDDEVRKSGGALAEAYALTRRALQRLDQAQADATSAEQRTAIATAMSRMHGTEDEIVKSVRLGRSS